MSTRSIVRVVLGTAISVAVACSDEGPAQDGDCPEGTNLMAVVGVDPTGGPFETREEAVRARLRVIEKPASDETISTALIASTPGEDPGTERIVIETSEGVDVTMVLAPQDPGWDVADTEWCAPAA